MLIQMAGVFMFWWALVLGFGVVVVMVLEKFVLKSRKSRKAQDTFALLLGQKPQPAAEPVVEAPAEPTSSGASPGEPRILFQAPLPEPRRYFIGKGPVDAHDKA